jgi:hypothetical protein
MKLRRPPEVAAGGSRSRIAKETIMTRRVDVPLAVFLCLCPVAVPRAMSDEPRTAKDREIEAIRFNDNIAIVMGSETIVRKVDAAETPKPVHRRFTNIWSQSTQGWRMIVRHANVVPGN